ncbi:MAG: hypothetical protein GKR94_15240 [Gammaproteobacteria bacterium]|nr:hypothetical protein [Gammaproteobacteria bacterium]
MSESYLRQVYGAGASLGSAGMDGQLCQTALAYSISQGMGDAPSVTMIEHREKWTAEK